MARKNTVDLDYYNDFLYCRVNKEIKKKLNIKALEVDKTAYELLDEILGNL